MCFHKWNKWKLIQEGKVNKSMYPFVSEIQGIYYTQEKICEKCGFIKRKTKEIY